MPQTPTPAEALGRKIDDRTAVVGVIGLGYVGLPLLAAFHKAGYRVLGFDLDPAKIDALNRGENYLGHLGAALVSDMAGDRFGVTTDMNRLGACDAVLSCVPTPLGRHLDPDLSYVANTATAAAATLRPGQLIVLESSTYPRTTREVMLPPCLARGMELGADFFMAYSPEREDPGSKTHSTASIPKLVGGLDPASGELARRLYATAIEAEIVLVESAEVAEAAKLLENIYRAVNIALVNEMKQVLTGRDGRWTCGTSIDAAARPSPSASRRSTPARGSAGTASRSTRST